MDLRAPGLRVQILAALAVLMALAFVPLFFAVASLARATLQAAREQTALGLGRAIAAHVVDVQSDPPALRAALERHVGHDGVLSACAFDASHATPTCAGNATGPRLRPPPGTFGEFVQPARVSGARAVDVVIPAGVLAVVTRVRTEEDAGRVTPLLGLVAMYMAIFALALLTFGYFALTRLIVRPIDRLAQAADRIASGTRTLAFPRGGAREIAELGASVQQMTASLVAEEAALRAKVEELTLTTRRLGEAREQLVRSERLASVGRLAAGIAHEIGNPIAALMGMEDLLLEGDLPGETEKDFLQRMKRETHRIHTVVRDLLDFARPEQLRERGVSTVGEADVREVFDDVAALLRPQKGFKGITLAIDAEPSLRVAIAADKLTQVVLNLGMNAGDAIGWRDGAPSESSLPAGRITLRGHAEGERVVLSIEDDGPGVPPDLRERVFDPFVTTKDVGRGTGLGLAVCRGLVESAGGVITVDASFQPGARFVVTLPRV